MTTDSVSAAKGDAIKDDASAKAKPDEAKSTGTMPANGPTPPPPIHLRNSEPAKLPPLALPAPGGSRDDRSKPKVVGKMESIEVSASDLLAALLCTSKDETRYYLKGVYIHRTADKFVRAVSTDGHRCLIANLYREHANKPGPKWLDRGVIIPADGLSARLKLIDKEHDDQLLGVKIAYGENQPRVEISDGFGVNVFRVTPIDGEFPKYEMVTTARWSGVGTVREDWKPTGFNPQYLKAVADIAKTLDSKDVQFFDYAAPDGKEQPVLVTFGKDADGVALFLMPQQTEAKLGAGTRMLLAPSIKLTLAALKAHETRNLEAAKKATGAEKETAQAKADDFARRIKEVLESAGAGQVQAALPAPKPKKPTKADKVRTWAKDKAATDKAAKQAHKAGVEAARAKAKAAKPKTATTTKASNGGKKPAAKAAPTKH
jgi:hypothetical protein